MWDFWFLMGAGAGGGSVGCSMDVGEPCLTRTISMYAVERESFRNPELSSLLSLNMNASISDLMLLMLLISCPPFCKGGTTAGSGKRMGQMVYLVASIQNR